MSFHLSSENLRVEHRNGQTWLVGNARREDGSENHTELNLDHILGNQDGQRSPFDPEDLIIKFS